ncbi:MAG: DNA polymerase III subunit beta [Armatimonadetes bacterium]|nr:MAG: DNA polymerase III subunit beta [Armatimonadota bacterium]
MEYVPDFKEHLAEIGAACRRFGVRRLWLFGSAVKGGWDPSSSDFDFMVDFGPRPLGMSALEQFFGLQRELEAVLDRRVDLVEFPAERNAFFERDFERHKAELYAA